jgi:NADPH2:quinone reductase
MQALLCTKYGDHQSLSLSDVAEPVVSAGEVVIDVHAASLNFPDLLVIQGLYQFRPEPPFVPGAEAAGIIAGIGEGVHHLSVGDRVAAVGVAGAFAERWTVDAESAIRIPDHVDFETAAATTLVYGTSYHALKQRAMLQPGEDLVVLGAAGGVGSAAIEIGKVLGAKVIAAASTDEKLAFCQSLGADATINYTTEDLKSRIKELTNGRGADVIVDPIGGALSEQAFRSIAWKGRHLVIGFAAGEIPNLPLNLPLLKGASIVGVFWGSFTKKERKQNAVNTDELFLMLSEGKIRPRLSATYSLGAYHEAFDALATRTAIGKIVFKIR